MLVYVDEDPAVQLPSSPLQGRYLHLSLEFEGVVSFEILGPEHN